MNQLGALQIWRVLHRTVNPVPLGKHSRFDSVGARQNPPCRAYLLPALPGLRAGLFYS